MGLFDRLKEKNNKAREEKARKREELRQELITLSDKELLVEILLELKELNEQSEEIRLNQAIYRG